MSKLTIQKNVNVNGIIDLYSMLPPDARKGLNSLMKKLTEIHSDTLEIRRCILDALVAVGGSTLTEKEVADIFSDPRSLDILYDEALDILEINKVESSFKRRFRRKF